MTSWGSSSPDRNGNGSAEISNRTAEQVCWGDRGATMVSRSVYEQGEEAYSLAAPPWTTCVFPSPSISTIKPPMQILLHILSINTDRWASNTYS